MSETTTEATTETAGETSADTSAEATSTETAAEEVDWRARFEAQQKITRDLEKKVKGEAGSLKTRLDELQAKLDGKEAEFTAAQESQRIKDEALNAANDRIRRSEVKAAAKGVLADPQDAYKFLDLDSFEVDDDGNVDEAAIAKALTDLVAAKPYLAAQGKRFQGGADGGTRNEGIKPSQLTEADVKRLSSEGKHEEIVKAKAEGRLADYLAS